MSTVGNVKVRSPVLALRVQGPGLRVEAPGHPAEWELDADSGVLGEPGHSGQGIDSVPLAFMPTPGHRGSHGEVGISPAGDAPRGYSAVLWGFRCYIVLMFFLQP